MVARREAKGFDLKNLKYFYEGSCEFYKEVLLENFYSNSSVSLYLHFFLAGGEELALVGEVLELTNINLTSKKTILQTILQAQVPKLINYQKEDIHDGVDSIFNF
jgi:hypothetical protein